MKAIRFPDDFVLNPGYWPDGRQWVYPDLDHKRISVVGGARGLYGDGVTTFEMWDKREDEPQGYLSIDQINEHFEKNPI